MTAIVHRNSNGYEGTRWAWPINVHHRNIYHQTVHPWQHTFFEYLLRRYTWIWRFKWFGYRDIQEDYSLAKHHVRWLPFLDFLSYTDPHLRYKRNIPLAGLLYFYRISDNRMAGSLLRNFRLFERICGKEFNRIVLVTTMWDQVDEQTGRKREEELFNIYWRTSISRGSSVARFQNTRVSAFEIMMTILRARNNQAPSPLLLQKEIASKGLKLSQTTAGKTLFTDPESIVNNQQRLLQRIQEELKKSPVDPDVLRHLEREHKELMSELPYRQPRKSLWKAGFEIFMQWTQRFRWAISVLILNYSTFFRKTKHTRAH